MSWFHLFDLLSILGGAADGVDAETLLENGHARFPFAVLDLGQAISLLLLPTFQHLHHTTVIALHLQQLLLTNVTRASPS